MDPEPHLPLTPVAFEILLSLVEEPRHGYAILQEIEGRTGGAMSLHAGTLYRALGRLVDDGLLEETEGPDGDGGDARRRYYGVTDRGRSVARAEAVRLQRQVERARDRRLLPDPDPA